MKTTKNMLTPNIGGIGKITSEFLVLQLMKLRNKKGITQNQLAKEINVSHTTIARIENFSMQPTLKMVAQILDVYGMTLKIVPQQQDNCLKIESHLENNKVNSTKKSSTTVQVMLKIITDFCRKVSFAVSSEEDYNEYLNSALLLYIEMLKNNNVDSHVVTKVSRFNKYITIILNEYCSGQHNLAYSFFKEALSLFIDIDLFVKDISSDSVFYRGRKKRKVRLTKNDMFHIPFEKRYKVSTQRYSFPGLPCLYLGSTPEVCASELDKDMSKLAIARFVYHNQENEYKVFDLTSLFFDYFSGLYEDCADRFLANFPLIFICSTYISYSDENDAKFKKEYIIPQLLLEYIINESILKENKLIGIKYFSVKENFIEHFLKEDYYSLKKICNYVFPTRDTSDSKGFCRQLENIFEIVEVKN